MALGRIRLDPPGFTANTEEGLSEIYSARRLYELFLSDPKDPTNTLKSGSFGFWNPGPKNRRDFLLPIPRQFNPRWFADARQQYHTLKKTQWTFAANTRVLTFQPSDKLFTGSTAHNEWLSIYSPSTVVSLDNTDYTNLFAAAGITPPAGMKTLAKCGVTPSGVGTPLGSRGYENYTPFVQALVYPPPDNAFVFGWSDFAIVLFSNGGYLLRNDSGDRKHWRRITWWNAQTHDIVVGKDWVGDDFAGALTETRAPTAGFLVAQLGMDSIWIDFLNGSGRMVQWRDAGFPPSAQSFATGPWWVAGGENQKIAFHAEIVGYEQASTGALGAVTRPILFDFGGPDLAPSATPTFLPVDVLHLEPGETAVVTTGFAGTSISDNKGEFIVYGLENYDAAPGTLWVSGPGVYRATMHLDLLPANAGSVNAGYLAPQIVLIELDFDQVKDARSNSELILYDHLHYDGWTVESGMYDAPHGAIRISVLESLSEEIENNGFHERSGYPIVYEESTDGGTTWVPRWKAWAEEPELHEEIVEGLTGVPGFRRYTIKARPIIARTDQKWSALPRIIDLNGNGFIEQSYAVEKVMSSASVNITDPNEWYAHPDPDFGTNRSRLPGTWGQHTGKGAEGDQDIWGPTWNETKLKYCQRIAKRWAQWVLYCQLNGRILYHPDLLQNPGEFEFFDAFPFYQTSEEAVAAGVRFDQIFTEVVDQEVIQPKWNVLSIYGNDDNENTVKAVIRDLPSIDGPLVVGEGPGLYLPDNFLGEKKPESMISRLAVGHDALVKLAMVGFRHGTRKRVVRRFSVDLAPWNFEGASDEPFDVGAGFFASGRGRFVCIHLNCRLVKRDVYRTIITGERVPVGTILGSFPGYFPGQGLL